MKEDDFDETEKTGIEPIDSRLQWLEQQQHQPPPRFDMPQQPTRLQNPGANQSFPSMGDPMRDLNAIDSQFSLMSISSAIHGDSKPQQQQDSRNFNDSSGTKGSDVLLGIAGRRSIMSGLSRMSDRTDMNSLFADLERKLETSSFPSIAMSEVSGIDGQQQEDLLFE